LAASGDLLPEATLSAGRRAARGASSSGQPGMSLARPALFGASGASATLPSPHPLPPMTPPPVQPAPPGAAPPPMPAGVAQGSLHSLFVIEARLRPNGEQRLSRRAVREDPAFFGFPFTGW